MYPPDVSLVHTPEFRAMRLPLMPRKMISHPQKKRKWNVQYNSTLPVNSWIFTVKSLIWMIHLFPWRENPSPSGVQVATDSLQGVQKLFSLSISAYQLTSAYVSYTIRWSFIKNKTQQHKRIRIRIQQYGTLYNTINIYIYICIDIDKYTVRILIFYQN